MSNEKLIPMFRFPKLKNVRECLGFKNLGKSNRMEHPSHTKFII
jgi:hypothetical protein